MNRLVPVFTLCAAFLLPSVSAPAESEIDVQDRAVITLVRFGDPDNEEIGRVILPGIDPSVLEETDPQYLRLALADERKVPQLPADLRVYQTVSTGVLLPVSVNFVVKDDDLAFCFNPEIPYCSDFRRLNVWFRRVFTQITDMEEAGSLARFVVELGMSTVHRAKGLELLRRDLNLPLEYLIFLNDIEKIYEGRNVPYRSEPEAEEYERVTRTYRDRVRPMTFEKVDDGFRLHGFTYKMMGSAGGDLREWMVLVHPDGAVDVDMKTLETSIGEVSWSWAR